ncbi:hypothetical protein [Bradyrhizobium erythrophlei]|uniref:hypothetical protein n=1 Tax=Bradyrhizobium erythrophlei TaxID=1437360 RepID=UPI00115F7E4C|nr:hypothetical protein [Bradyrhizobium erythrophlei]
MLLIKRPPALPTVAMMMVLMLVAVHGNRFILFYVFNHIDLNQLKRPNVDLQQHVDECERLALICLEAIIPKINELFPDSYPGNIFKNQDRQAELLALT